MPNRSRTTYIISAFIVLLLVALASVAWRVQHNAGALWRILSQQCIPGQRQHGDPAPCQQVDEAQGYVTLKDRNGSLQYLLLPVARISGIESPRVLDPATPNFFAQAWRQRHLLAQRHGAPVPDSAISLTLNSACGRSQNQLHIHISCLRPEIRQRLDRLAPQLSARWQSVMLGERPWLMRTLSQPELEQQSSLIRLAQEIPGARQEMGKYGMALVPLADGRLVLMAIKRNWLRMNLASAEELQDHDCHILQSGKKNRAG